MLLFADDIVLIADSSLELRKMIVVLEEYTRVWRFEVNNKKCGVLGVGNAALRKSVSNSQWAISGMPVAVVQSYKYLGVEFSCRRGRGKWNEMLSRFVERARAQLNLVVWQGGGARGLLPSTFRQLFTAQVRPMLEYAAAIWDGEIADMWVRKLERVQYDFLRVVLGCGRKSKPAAAALRAELGLPSLQARRYQLRLGYWAKLCSAEPNRLLSTVFRNRWREACQGGAGTSCLQATRRVMDELGFVEGIGTRR
jgi:hypothetical protein